MKLKKLTLLLLIVSIFMCLPLLTSCSRNKGQVPTQAETEQVPTQAEMQEMFDEAKEYEANAKFKDAIKFYRQLNEYGFNDPDFGSRSETVRESRYANQSVACKYFSFAVSSLKSQLKDPNSLVVYSMNIDSRSPSGKITIVFDYGAKNSFGGMVRDEYTTTYTLSESEKEKIYKANKEHMDSIGFTKEDAGQYLSGNFFMFKTSQYDAIVAGTCNY